MNSLVTKTKGKGPEKARRIVEQARNAGRTALFEYESDEIAKLYNIHVPRAGLAKSEKEAVDLSRKISYPVVMKILSPDIIHKTDAGGVVLNIKSAAEAMNAYSSILKNVRRFNKNAAIVGVYVQKMAPSSHEFVVGATRDPQFGPTVMFGLGGIYVEIFKDVSFRLAPLSKEEALEMIDETKSSKLLEGFRGEKPLDRESAAEVIQQIGNMMNDISEIESIDLNPLFIYPKGVIAPDVRIIPSAKDKS